MTRPPNRGDARDGLLRLRQKLIGERPVDRAADISGAGSTFAYPIYSKWAEAYKKETGIGVNYQAIGSGNGITQIQNKEVTFAASDMPLSVVDLDTDGL